MSSRHAVHFRPEPVKPVRYRTHRTWFQRLRPVLLALLAAGVVFGVATCAAGLVARMYVTDAQLDEAYLRGLSSGQTMCGGR